MPIPNWLWRPERTDEEQRAYEAMEFARATGEPACRRHWQRRCSACRGDWMEPALYRWLCQAALNRQLTTAEINRILTPTRHQPPEMESTRRPHKWRVPKPCTLAPP